MITLDMAIAFAIKDRTVMDQLGEALRSDLVTADPFKRRIVEFADTMNVERRKLPSSGDYEVWLDTLEEGGLRDGTRVALGRLWQIDTSGFDPQFFAANVLPQIQMGAARVAMARLNEVKDVSPAAITMMAERLNSIGTGSLQGLARLSDIDTWATPVREDDLVSTGYATLNRHIGGFGKELWIAFADSGMGKSMLLQNFAVHAARGGRNVLHISLELGIRPQIHRYYRQLTQMSRAEFATDQDETKRRLRQWFRLAQGSIYVMEFPALSLDMTQLRRVVERAGRVMEKVDMLVLDYLDLMAPSRRGRGGAYEDLGILTHESRALCSMFDLTVLTASQAVRRAEGAKRLTQKDMGDSYQKVRGADGLISLVQTKEEEEVHQGRLGLIKVRDGGGRNTEIALYINRELSVISELDHPNTVALMKRLGHLPKPTAAPVPPTSPAKAKGLKAI